MKPNVKGCAYNMDYYSQTNGIDPEERLHNNWGEL
jgi:hypothetical protein